KIDAIRCDVGAVQVGIHIAIIIGVVLAIRVRIAKTKNVRFSGKPLAAEFEAVDFGFFPPHAVDAVGIGLQPLAKIGIGAVVADLCHQHLAAIFEAQLGVLCDDGIETEEAVNALVGLVDATQHTTDVRHGKAFGIVAEYAQADGQLIGGAHVVEGFGKIRLAALYELAAVGRKRDEVVHIQGRILVAQARGQGQTVDAGEFGLYIGRNVVVLGFRHPVTSGLHKLLVSVVGEDVHTIDQSQGKAGQVALDQSQLEAGLLGVVLGLIPQQARTVGRVLETVEAAAAIGAGKILSEKLQAQL